MGRVGNGAAEEDWCWDLNPGTAAIPERTIRLWWRRERTMLLWQSGDPVAVTQLMVLGA